MPHMLLNFRVYVLATISLLTWLMMLAVCITGHDCIGRNKKELFASSGSDCKLSRLIIEPCTICGKPCFFAKALDIDLMVGAIQLHWIDEQICLFLFRP